MKPFKEFILEDNSPGGLKPGDKLIILKGAMAFAPDGKSTLCHTFQKDTAVTLTRVKPNLAALNGFNYYFMFKPPDYEYTNEFKNQEYSMAGDNSKIDISKSYLLNHTDSESAGMLDI